MAGKSARHVQVKENAIITAALLIARVVISHGVPVLTVVAVVNRKWLLLSSKRQNTREENALAI
jgi:hypothetical protein